MAVRVGTVRFILGIAVLIVVVQILAMLHFSSTIDDHYGRRRHNVGRGNVNSFVPMRQQGNGQKQDINDAPNIDIPFVPPCNLRHKDALSAVRRVKSESCRRTIIRTACLAESKRLHDIDIKRTCPVPRSKGSPAKWIDVSTKPYGPPIRIAYVLTVHGRAFRQVKRLFKAIYHIQHYFYFHVDSRSDYLRREILKMIRDFPNAAIAPWNMATIWGGASLLKMLLRCMSDLLSKKEWKWDFFINLSGSDFPIKDNNDLTEFLRARRDYNFLKPHGREQMRFVKKQGLDRTFVECDERMWRLGNRPIPPDIDIDGGSDWIALNHEFCHFLVLSNDPLVTKLKHMYSYALLPAESFFHTVLRNGPFCEKFIKTNLRLTNWKRKLGCRCQYKHVVDWCGCSPNDFKPEDMPRIKSQTTSYFARKFEAIVNQEVITKLDGWLYGEYPQNTPGLRYYWENMFHHEDSLTKTSDIFRTFFHSFSRLATEKINRPTQTPGGGSSCHVTSLGTIREVTYLNQQDQLGGLLVLFDVESVSGDGAKSVHTVEAWMAPQIHEELLNLNASKGPQRLTGLQVGSAWDQKERIFRNMARLLSPWDDPVLVHHWVHGEAFDVKIMWIDPINVVTGIYEMNAVENWVVSFHKPNFKKPLRPGRWTIKMVFTDKGEDHVIGQTSFLVAPLAFKSGQPISTHDAMAANNGPPGGIYNSNDFLIEFDREANNTVAMATKAAENARKSGHELHHWIDSLVKGYWAVEGLCVAGGELPGCEEPIRCELTNWSSRSPDPKSEIGKPNSFGRLR